LPPADLVRGFRKRENMRTIAVILCILALCVGCATQNGATTQWQYKIVDAGRNYNDKTGNVPTRMANRHADAGWELFDVELVQPKAESPQDKERILMIFRKPK